MKTEYPSRTLSVWCQSQKMQESLIYLERWQTLLLCVFSSSRLWRSSCTHAAATAWPPMSWASGIDTMTTSWSQNPVADKDERYTSELLSVQTKSKQKHLRHNVHSVVQVTYSSKTPQNIWAYFTYHCEMMWNKCMIQRLQHCHLAVKKLPWAWSVTSTLLLCHNVVANYYSATK